MSFIVNDYKPIGAYSATGTDTMIAWVDITCNDVSDLPAANAIVPLYTAAMGSKAHVVSNQLDYELSEYGVWVQKQSQDLTSIITTLSNLDAEVDTLGLDLSNLHGVTADIKDVVQLLVDDCKNKIVLIPSMSTGVGSLNITVNNDGTVTLNGTNDTGSAAFFSAPITFPAGHYMFTGMQESGGTSSYRQELRATPGGAVYQVNDNESATEFERTTDYSGYYSIRIANGFVANNVVIKPMIAIEKFYAFSSAFKAGAPTNRELYQLIRGYHS